MCDCVCVCVCVCGGGGDRLSNQNQIVSSPVSSWLALNFIPFKEKRSSHYRRRKQEVELCRGGGGCRWKGVCWTKSVPLY